MNLSFAGVCQHTSSARLRLGMTPQEAGLPPTLRVDEVVDFVAGHFPDPPATTIPRPHARTRPRHAETPAIREFHAGDGTVLLTSHYLEEVDALADRVVVIDHGRVLIDDTVQRVRAQVGVRRISYRLGGQAGERVEELVADADDRVRELVTHGVDFHDWRSARPAWRRPSSR